MLELFRLWRSQMNQNVLNDKNTLFYQFLLQLSNSRTLKFVMVRLSDYWSLMVRGDNVDRNTAKTLISFKRHFTHKL